MINWQNINLKRAYFLLFFIVLTVISSNINWGGERWKNTLQSDAKGYYAYNPAIFIYQDLAFDFFDDLDSSYKGPYRFYYEEFRVRLEEGNINKYFIGTALSQSPFFLISHFISYISDKDTSGYSKMHILSVTVAAIFYFLLGLHFIFKILNNYSIRGSTQLILGLVIFFGSNLFVYTIVEPGMSHVYSFAWICMFLYAAQSLSIKSKAKTWLLLCFALSMLILVRPINVLVLAFIPFFGSKTFLKNTLHLNPVNLVAGVLLGTMMIGIQILCYYLGAGELFTYSYEYETFNFRDPHLFDILFSYRKGLFIYTPLYLISFLGLYFIYKNERDKVLIWVGFFVLITYVFSSWWMWYYGASFSSRVYVEYLPLFSIPLAFAMDKLQLWKKKAFLSLLLLIVVFCQIQSYQYRYYIIHFSEMNKTLYWENFLKLKK